VLAGIGLPAVFKDPIGYMTRERCAALAKHDWPALVVVDDPLTAFGLAMRLDKWEGIGRWVVQLTSVIPVWKEPTGERFLQRMKRRVESIGMDHAIRRKLWPDEEIEPGSLASLTSFMGGVWRLSTPETEHWFAADVDHANDHGVMVDVCLPEMEDVIDPGEVWKLIHAEVCS